MWDWLINILRIFFFFLDSIVYPLIPTIYNLFMDIANTTIFTEDIIDLFASKVYALLGIFMLFKVSFSILTYIVNPDDFTDKTKGFGKMISNIMLSLALLLLTPWIFSQAMDIQRIILNDNIIGKIFSVSSVSNISSTDAGNTMAYETFLAFYHIDTENVGYEACAGADKGKTPDTDACRNYLGDKYNDFKNILEVSYVARDVNFYIDFDLLNVQNGSDEYIMSYMPLISTLAGVFVFWVLLMFCFDIAVRSIKLGFLRMIAPVPIISRIDPKKGNDIFNKWVKMSLSTYLDLFVRLLAIYFAVFVISIVANGDFVDAATGLPADVDPFVKIFIIMGALLFAKQFPKLIEDLTGIKMNGKFTINPFKKMSEVPLLGAGVHTLAGGIDSKLHGNGFWSGVKRNYKDIPLLGGDGKTSIWETSDRKMRREIRQKRDYAKQRYEGLARERLLNEQLEIGEKNYNIIEKNKGLEKKGAAQYDGVYRSDFAESKAKVDSAKDLMYAWENEVTRREALYQHNLDEYGENDSRTKTAFKSYEDAKKNYGSAKGQYDYRKQLHDSVRLQMPEEAKIEDAVEAYEKTRGKTINSPKSKPKANNSENNSSDETSNDSGNDGSDETPNDSENNGSDETSNDSENGSSDETPNNSQNGSSDETPNDSQNGSSDETPNDSQNGSSDETSGNNVDSETAEEINNLMQQYHEAYARAEQASATFKAIHDQYISTHGEASSEKTKQELYRKNVIAERAKEQAIREVDMIVDRLGELGVEVSKFIDTYR